MLGEYINCALYVAINSDTTSEVFLDVEQRECHYNANMVSNSEMHERDKIF